MKSYDVKFWAIRPGKAKTKRTYEVRWRVGPQPHSRTIGNRAQAENFLSDLRQAARTGQAFDIDSGLPDSMTTIVKQERSWFQLCLAYVDMKWPSAAPKTRDALTDALASIVPAVVGEERPSGVEMGALRQALRHFALAPNSRTQDRPPDVAAALRWLEKASLPVSEVGKPIYARAVLDAISVRQDGAASGATTIARKRSVFANVLGYAIELEELTANPLERLSWKPPKVSEVVDRRGGQSPPGTSTAGRRYLCRPATPRAARPWSAADGAVRLHVLRRPAAGRGCGAAAAGLPSSPHRVGLADPGEVTAGSQPALERHRLGA